MWVATFFLFIAALGPGLFSKTANIYQSWQFDIFNVLCHQDHARSFTVSGVQMAVCARCIGIYGGLFAGWLLMPVYAFFQNGSTQKEKVLLIAAILLNLTDVAGNFFGLWTNTMISRWILGSMIGLPAAFILSQDFFQLKIGVSHGNGK